MFYRVADGIAAKIIEYRDYKHFNEQMFLHDLQKLLV